MLNNNLGDTVTANLQGNCDASSECFVILHVHKKGMELVSQQHDIDCMVLRKAPNSAEESTCRIAQL